MYVCVATYIHRHTYIVNRCRKSNILASESSQYRGSGLRDKRKAVVNYSRSLRRNRIAGCFNAFDTSMTRTTTVREKDLICTWVNAFSPSSINNSCLDCTLFDHAFCIHGTFLPRPFCRILFFFFFFFSLSFFYRRDSFRPPSFFFASPPLAAGLFFHFWSTIRRYDK